MDKIQSFWSNLNIHFEDIDTIFRRTIIAALAIFCTSLAVFGIDTIVSSLIAMMT